MKKSYMMSVGDVTRELDVSKCHAYKLIRQMNRELEKGGYVVVAGKVPRTFLKTKFFGMGDKCA